MSKTRRKNRDEERVKKGLGNLGDADTRKEIFGEQKPESRLEIDKRIAEMEEKVSEILADIKEKKLENLIGRLLGQVEEVGMDILSLGEQAKKAMDGELEGMREKVSAFTEVVEILEREYKKFVESVQRAQSSRLEEAPKKPVEADEAVNTEIPEPPVITEEKKSEVLPVEVQEIPLTNVQGKEGLKESGELKQDPEEYVKKKFEKKGLPKGEKAIPWVVGEIISDVKKSKFLDLYDKEEIRPKLRALREAQKKQKEEFIVEAAAIVKQIDEIFKQNKSGNTNLGHESARIGETVKVEAVSGAPVEEAKPVINEKSQSSTVEKKLAPGIPALDLEEPDLSLPLEPAAPVVVLETASGNPNWEVHGEIGGAKAEDLGEGGLVDQTPTVEVEIDKVLVPSEPAEAGNLEILKIVLEEKRQAYEEDKKEYDKSRKLTARIGRLFSRKKGGDAGIDFAIKKDEYETAKAEYAAASVALAMEEQTVLADERILENAKWEGMGQMVEVAWSDILGIYKKLGDWNLEAVMENKPKSWLGKVGTRMLSVRSAINAILMGVGFMTGGVGLTFAGAGRAVMRFIGTTGLTYDVLQIAARAKEEKSGLLSDLTDEAIAELKSEDAIQRLQTIEVVSVLDGVDLGQSKYKDLYDRLLVRVDKIYSEERPEAVEFSEEEIVKAWNDFFDKNGWDLDKKIKELKKIRGRHKLIAVGAGIVSASGLLGQAIGNVLEKTGVNDVVRGWFGHTQVSHEVGSAEIPVDAGEVTPAAPEVSVPVEEMAPRIDFTGLSPSEVHNQLEDSLGYDAVAGEEEGITHVIFKDIAAHPDRLQFYADKIPEVKELLSAHNGNVEELFKTDMNAHNLPTDTRKILFDIYKYDFKDDAVHWEEAAHIKEPGKVYAIYDKGHYNLGTVDGSEVKDHLEKYEEVEMEVKKMPTRIETVDEAGNISPEISYDGSLKQYEEMNFGPEKGVKIVRRITVPVDLPPGSTVGGLNELSDAVARITGRTTAEAAPSLNAASELINPYGETPEAAPAGEGTLIPISHRDEIPVETEKAAPETPEIAPNEVARAEYKFAWMKYNEKIKDLLKPENVAHYDDQTFDYIKGVRKELNELSDLDIKNKELVEALSPSSRFTPEEMTALVEDEIVGKMPNEAQILLTEIGQGNDISVFEDGSRAVKFFDKTSGKTVFVYNEDCIFKGSEGRLLVEKGGVDYSIKPPFFENGELKKFPWE